MVFLSSFESVVSKLEKRSKNRASKKFVFDTRATAKERITRISSNNYNFLIFLSFAFGKDEVGGSNPPSSSKSIENFGFRCFFVVKTLKDVWVKMRVNCLTHTLTHTRKYAERAKKGRKGSSAIYQMAFATFNAQYAYSFIF